MSLYFKTDLGELHVGDAFRLMKDIKPESVDLILTDPPYNIAETNRDNRFSGLRRQKTLPVEEWDEGFQTTLWLEDAFRILKPTGSLIIFNTMENISEIIPEIKSLGYNYKRIIRWVKPNPMPRNLRRTYLLDYEFALWVTKGEKWTFNGYYLKPEFAFSSPVGKLHPTQKPIGLMRSLIRIHSNENDLVIDPFSGSGTTVVACEELGRRWTAFEKEEKYCGIAENRIKEVYNQINLFNNTDTEEK